jgi:two-component system, OmpR family, sensor kinase
MSLTGRFSALFLAALGLALIVFSAALYISARVYLEHRVHERLDATLSILAAAAEIHSDDVQWEPHERVVMPGQESGPDRMRWMVLDERGQPVDRSRNLAGSDDLAEELARRGDGDSGRGRLVDRRGGTWRVSQRVLRPAGTPTSGSRGRAAGQGGGPSAARRRRGMHASLILVACAPLGPTEATLATLAGLLAALSVGICLLAAAVCRGLSRRALLPLTRMVESARGLDAADPGWCLAEAGTGDELDDLGRAFNDLLGRLHIAYERQRRFSGDASHQLRTPLTVLIGQLQVALRHERSGEEYRRALTSSLGRAEQLARIVEALLFLSRAEAEAGLPGVEPMELHGWTAEHLASRPAAGGETRIVHHPDGPDPLWIRAHPALLGQLLDNLLDNAARHGPSDSPIVVETLRGQRGAILAVEDRGPGIAPADLPHIFEPFYRSAQARRRGVPGVGLGLAVVRRIATACGGCVSVHSEPGAGARFEVHFPTMPEPAEPVDESGEIDRLSTAGVESKG